MERDASTIFSMEIVARNDSNRRIIFSLSSNCCLRVNSFMNSKKFLEEETNKFQIPKVAAPSTPSYPFRESKIAHTYIFIEYQVSRFNLKKNGKLNGWSEVPFPKKGKIRARINPASFPYRCAPVESFRWFDFWRGCAVSAGFIPVARSVSRTLTSRSRGGATGSITMQRIGRAEGSSRVTRRKRAERWKGREKTGWEASERRQDRRRQPAITSWNVWERVGLWS